MTHTTYSDQHIKFENNDADVSTKSPKPRREKRPDRSGMFEWEGPYNTVRGETALWVAVITQAMMDALSRARNSEAMYHKHEAIRWLSDNSKDFRLVCMLAERDPDAIRRQAKRALVSPVSWRAAAGHGKRYNERKAYRQRLKKCRPKPSSPPPADSGHKVIVGPW